MVSNAKRLRYDSENYYTSSEDDTIVDYGASQPDQEVRKSKIYKHCNGLTDFCVQDFKYDQRPKNKNKRLSKNAIMARENRLKKKLYVSNLEKEVAKLRHDNGNFTKVIENQSLLLTDLKKEIKYLKSVIANSTDIGHLIKSVHNTGMSVKTSLEQSLSLNNCISKPKQPIARKTAHPWEENRVSHYPSFPTPESDLFSSPNSECRLDEFNDDILNLVPFDNILEFSESYDTPDAQQTKSMDEGHHLEEHNYTTPAEDEEVGVCLHVSKHRISLEFCSTCSENASHTWSD
jgi:hypothetical protein